MWRRRALGVFGVWGLVSVARLTRLVELPEAPPGQELAPLLEFLRAHIPIDAGYLYVLPGELGSDTGTAPRLRYELYPRRYDDIRASVDESAIRDLMQATRLRFIVVPDASRYLPTSWLRQPRDWLRHIDFDANRYLLEVVT
ncbi:MAG: hypothetical protein M3069_29305 [Chloroflexota bacterium]|nr:hypothetical protein [Chloroflexota bacterium]